MHFEFIRLLARCFQTRLVQDPYMQTSGRSSAESSSNGRNLVRIGARRAGWVAVRCTERASRVWPPKGSRSRTHHPLRSTGRASPAPIRLRVGVPNRLLCDRVRHGSHARGLRRSQWAWARSVASDLNRATRAPMRTNTNSSATTAACSAACRCLLSRRLSEGRATADTDCLYSQQDGCGRDGSNPQR